MTTTFNAARRRSAFSTAIAATAVAMIIGASASASASAAPITLPPFNQDGIESAFQVGCFFTTDQNGDPLRVDDAFGTHDADLSNPDDLAFVMNNTPSFFEDSMEAFGATQYPFPVSVDASIGTSAENRLPTNPLPGESYPGPYASNLSLVLPSTVAHVIREKAGENGLIGTVTAHASLDTAGANGLTSSALTSDPFLLGTAENPVVPVDSFAEIPIETTGLWRDIVFPADWNTSTADIVFGGTDAVSVSVEVVDQADPATPEYALNLTCFPNGAGGSTSVPVTIGQLQGNFVGTPPTIVSDAPGNGTVGTAYDYQFDTDGTDAISYAVTSGALPTGLTLDPATGELTGTPSETGTFTFSVSASNEYGVDEETYSVVVAGKVVDGGTTGEGEEPAGETGVDSPPTEPAAGETSAAAVTASVKPATATGSLAVTGNQAPVAGLVIGVLALAGGATLIGARRLLRAP